MALWITISLAGYACIIVAFALMLHWLKKDTAARIEVAEKRIRMLEKQLDLHMETFHRAEPIDFSTGFQAGQNAENKN